MHEKKDWVHLSHQGAKPSDQKKEQLEPCGNFSFGVRTAWTVVCCWEFLAQQTVWSREGVSRRQQRGREESMSHLGLQTGEGSCQVSGCPWGGLHSAGLPQLKSAVLGTRKSTFLCLNAGISQTHHGNDTGISTPGQFLGLHPAKFILKFAEAIGIIKAPPLSVGGEVSQQATIIPSAMCWLHGSLNQR